MYTPTCRPEKSERNGREREREREHVRCVQRTVVRMLDRSRVMLTFSREGREMDKRNNDQKKYTAR